MYQTFYKKLDRDEVHDILAEQMPQEVERLTPEVFKYVIENFEDFVKMGCQLCECIDVDDVQRQYQLFSHLSILHRTTYTDGDPFIEGEGTGFYGRCIKVFNNVTLFCNN
jgi:hypothetical protein